MLNIRLGRIPWLHHSSCRHVFGRHRGSLTVEFVLGFGVLISLLSGFLVIGRLALLKQRANRLARYGTMLQSINRLDMNTVQLELSDHSNDLFGKDVESSWELGRFLDIPGAAFYRLVKTKVRVQSTRIPFKVESIVVCQQEVSSS